MAMMSTSSNAESWASCRLPVARVTSHRKKKSTVARITISISAPLRRSMSWRHPHAEVHLGDDHVVDDQRDLVHVGRPVLVRCGTRVQVQLERVSRGWVELVVD